MTLVDWIAANAKKFTAIVLHGVVVLAVMAGLVAAGLGGLWIYNSGWAAKLAPALPTVDPLKVRLHGAPIVVRGTPNIFVAEISGQTGEPVWKVIPTSGGKVTPIGNRAAEFSTLEAGNVTLSVMVAGQGFQVTSDQIDVEVVDFTERHDPEPGPPTPQPVAPPQPAPPPVPTVAEYAAGALANVQSPDRAAEARVIAGTIKSIIGRLQTGLLPPDTDVVVEIETQATHALGTKAAAWHNFFVSMNIAIDILRQQGMVTTAASTIGALSEIATVLNKAN